MWTILQLVNTGNVPSYKIKSKFIKTSMEKSFLMWFPCRPYVLSFYFLLLNYSSFAQVTYLLFKIIQTKPQWEILLQLKCRSLKTTEFISEGTQPVGSWKRILRVLLPSYSDMWKFSVARDFSLKLRFRFRCDKEREHGTLHEGLQLFLSASAALHVHSQ